MKPEEIKNLRKRLKLSQEKFADLVDVTRSTVARWEGKKQRPTRLAVRRLNRLLRKYQRRII